MRWLVALVLLAVASPARGDGEPPWAVGVSEERKAAAEKLLDAGNALFLDHKYADALESYRQALAAWDHPAIRFNIVRCLIQIDRPVEASDQLDAALKYGAAPLGEALYSEALGYRKLLAGQIAEVEVTCAQAGVALRLDGQPLATCPADEKRRVAPGPHQVVGSLAGYLTRSFDVVALGGKSQKVPVELPPVASAAVVVHRWPAWLPWTVFGAGFALGGAGGLVERFALAQEDKHDKEVAAKCMPVRCATDPAPGTRDSASRANAFAIGLFSVGAATIATGAVMLYMNRGRTVVPDLEPAPSGATLGVSGRF